MIIRTWQLICSVAFITTITVLYQIPSSTWVTSASFSLIAGCISLAFMATACILSSRWSFLEDMFGGLDRMYDIHKWLGIYALIFAAFHLVFKAKMNLWDLDTIVELSKYWSRFFRQLSFVALGFILILSLNRNIPYSTWRWWHKLSGPLFIIVILHWLSIASPIFLFSPAGIWLALLCILGISAAFYKLFLYNLFSQGGTYKIIAIDREAETIHLVLEPYKKSFNFEAGQFAFFSIMQNGLREPHPFSIASANVANRQIHFVIRVLGDYTKKLYEQAQIGMLADIRAPHGRFKRPENVANELWIGAGVGITPFISWLKDIPDTQHSKAKLLYCFSPDKAFPAVERIQELAKGTGVQVVPTPSGSSNLAEAIHKAASEAAPSSVHIYFCGPKGLLAHVKHLMREADIPQRNIHYEIFEFR